MLREKEQIMPKVILVDDDREMLDITAASFRAKGYAVSVFDSGASAVGHLRSAPADCVVLDVMMPGMNGFDVCKSIRQVSNVPILFLTGRVSEEDKVNGLLLGADDYIEKPFSFRELEARVQAAVRRSQASAPGTLSFPPLEIDVTGHRALCDGKDLQLTIREYDILYHLINEEKKIVTYEDIGKRVWGVYSEQDRRSVMVMVSRLRKKLEVNPVAATMIETVWSAGYRFNGTRR